MMKVLAGLLVLFLTAVVAAVVLYAARVWRQRAPEAQPVRVVGVILLMLGVLMLSTGIASQALVWSTRLFNLESTTLRPDILKGIEYPSDGALAVVADSQGNTYRLLNDLRRIQVYRPDGTFMLGFFYETPPQPWPLLAIDTQDRLYIGSRASGVLYRYRLDGTPDGIWTEHFLDRQAGRWDGRSWVLDSSGEPVPGRASTEQEAQEGAVGRAVKPGERIFPYAEKDQGLDFADASGKRIAANSSTPRPISTTGWLLDKAWIFIASGLVLMMAGSTLLRTEFD